MMSQSEKTFTYFASKKSHFLVVSFVGAMNDSKLSTLEQCKIEIQTHADIRALVLHFAEVSEVGMDAVSVLAHIQQWARGKNILLRLSGLTGDLLERLYKKGVIRKQELTVDLKEALLHVARQAQQSPGEGGSQAA